MRRSKILLGTLAVVTGLLIGMGNAKEVKADTDPPELPVRAGVTNVILASDINKAQQNDDNENCGDNCQVALISYEKANTVTLYLDEDVSMKKLVAKDGWGGSNDNFIDLTIIGKTGKKLTVDSSDLSGTIQEAIYVNRVTIESGVISATSSGDRTINAINGNIVIKGGKVTANSSGDNGVGINADNNKVIISGNATVEATGATGINGAGIEITGATVTATGTGGEYYAGIFSGAGVSISSNATVTATGTDGIFSNRGVTISGKNTVVEASGNQAAIRIFDGAGTDYIITIEPPLGVINPAGGGISKDKRSISTTSGGEEIAKAVLIKKDPAWTYKVTTEAQNGTAKATPETAEADTEIKLEATPADGYKFVKWKANNTDVKFVPDDTSANATFSMIEDDVTVTAVFEKKQADEYTVKTVVDPEDAGTALADPSTAKEGTKITLRAGNKEGYEFVEWTSEDGVKFADAKSSETTFDMPGKNVTVKANFKKKDEPGPKTRVVVNSTETITPGEKYGMYYSICDTTGKAFKNVKISGFELSGDVPEGIEIVRATNDNGDCYLIKGTATKPGTYKAKLVITFTSDEFPDGAVIEVNITCNVGYKPNFNPGDDDDDTDTVDKTPPAKTNPLALILIRTKGLPYGTYAARAEQGPAAKAALTATVPAGFKEAFTFNLITNNTTEVTLKNGGFTLLIPADLQKPGRTFKLLAIDKNGRVFILPDLDNDPTTITVEFNLEGFAFDLIYKD